MAQSYRIPEVKQRIAQRIRDTIDRVANEFEDLEKREHVRDGLLNLDLSKALGATGLMDAAHAEPGAHEAATPGVAPHMEPGQDEQFVLNPPAGPDIQDPVGSGTGVPPGQMGFGGHDPNMHGGNCPLCNRPDAPGSCQCLSDLMLGKNEIMGYGPGAPGGGPAAPVAKNEMCKSCGKEHTDACKTMEKDELPPEKGGEKYGDGKGSQGKVKENPLGKTAVPTAKPPSGKVPGQQAAPVASNTSKPGLAKVSLNPQMKQHAIMDASKQAAGKPLAGANPATQGVSAGKTLTHPNDMGRANAFQDALGGAFAPKGPVTAGADSIPLATPAAGKLAPQGLKAPPSSVRAPIPNPKAAPAPAKTGMFGKLFGKSEKCPFCNRDEHPGDCTKK